MASSDSQTRDVPLLSCAASILFIIAYAIVLMMNYMSVERSRNASTDACAFAKGKSRDEIGLEF